MCPPLNPEQSARVATAMLAHTAVIVEQSWGGQCVLNASPDLSHSVFDEYKRSHSWATRVQVQSDLGERMREALQEGVENCGAAAVLGTDIPAINADILTEAIQALQVGQPVVGPSEDGGFYLLGLCKQAPSELFSGIEWGSASVYDALCANAKSLNIDLKALSTLSDCDYFEELKIAADTIPTFTQALARAGFDIGLFPD